MNYGKGAAPTVAGVAILPATGNNSVLFFVAAGCIAVGVVVFAISVVLSRKAHTSAN